MTEAERMRKAIADNKAASAGTKKPPAAPVAKPDPAAKTPEKKKGPAQQQPKRYSSQQMNTAKRNAVRQALAECGVAPEYFDSRAQAKGRLPDKSRYTTVYDAATEKWAGELFIPGVGQFDLSGRGGLFRMLAELDDLYRKTLPEKPPCEEKTSEPSSRPERVSSE